MPPTMDKWIDGVVAEVGAEVRRAGAKHAPMNSAHEAYAVILEELDEFWEMVKVNPNKLPLAGQAKRLADMRNELIQVAAMAVRAVCDLDLALTPSQIFGRVRASVEAEGHHVGVEPPYVVREGE